MVSHSWGSFEYAQNLASLVTKQGMTMASFQQRGGGWREVIRQSQWINARRYLIVCFFVSSLRLKWGGGLPDEGQGNNPGRQHIPHQSTLARRQPSIRLKRRPSFRGLEGQIPIDHTTIDW